MNTTNTTPPVTTKCPRCHGKGFTVQGDECFVCEGSGK